MGGEARDGGGEDGTVRLTGRGGLFVEAGPWTRTGCRPDRTVVAVGDVHGRTDLLGALEEALAGPAAEWIGPDAEIVLLGDLIDRGPDSFGALAAARRGLAGLPTSCVMGNHEQMLRIILAENDPDFVSKHIDLWAWNGGDAAMSSFGIDPAGAAERPVETRDELFRVLEAGVEWLEALPVWRSSGNVLFVHAGIHPSKPIDEFLGAPCDRLPHWDAESPLWIREPFLGWDEPLPGGLVVVHGHTISPTPETAAHRIGIDTGAALHGALTAVVLRPDGTGRFVCARSRANH